MDFSTRDVSVLSKQGVTFDILDIAEGNIGNPTGAQAKLHGPESAEFAKANEEFEKQLGVLHGMKKADKKAVQTLGIKRLAACTIELINCSVGDKEYTTDKKDIESFYSMFPFVFDQMEKHLVSRSDFLPKAAEATNDM